MATSDKDLAAAIAATRFGLGARAGEIAAARSDPAGWLRSQVRRSGADQPQGEDGPLPTMVASFAGYSRLQDEMRAQRIAAQASSPQPAMAAMAPNGQSPPRAGDLQAARRMTFAPLREEVVDEMLGRARLGAATTAPFRERWALFWANHFTVAARTQAIASAVGPFEREAIRPHVFGRFHDLLVATSTHPGMILYLDQAQSIGPDSQAGRRRNAGLNENLAREILELHTVGADAGYTQADVTEFARALTGWSMGGLNSGPEMGRYLYRAAMHEPGERQVMGRRYRPGEADQAEAILADLAAHPATARRIARKLAVHFVADDPPPALVARLEAAWRKSGGDLSEVADALIAAPEAWAPAPAKLKTPYEFLVSAYRAADAAPTLGPREVAQPLTSLGQRPFSAPQPNGWSDQAADWAAPDAMVKRLAWARAFADRYAPQGSPTEAGEAALGARMSPQLQTAVARAESRPAAFTLLLMSPEFQRR